MASVTVDGARSSAVTKGITGSATPTGALAKAASVTLAGIATVTGVVTLAVALALAGSVAASGQVAKAVTLSLAGSIATAGSLVRSVALALVGVVTLTATRALAAAKALAGSVTPTGFLDGYAEAEPGGTYRRPLWSWPRAFTRALASLVRAFRRSADVRSFTRDRPTLARSFTRSPTRWGRLWRYAVPDNTIPPVELTKAVSDDRDYAFDFSKAPELATGTGITISSGEVTGGSGLTFGAVTVLAAAFDGIPIGKGVQCRISGGSDDSTYDFAMKITLSNSRVLVMPCRLAVAADYE